MFNVRVVLLMDIRMTDALRVIPMATDKAAQGFIAKHCERSLYLIADVEEYSLRFISDARVDLRIHIQRKLLQVPDLQSNAMGQFFVDFIEDVSMDCKYRTDEYHASPMRSNRNILRNLHI